MLHGIAYSIRQLLQLDDEESVHVVDMRVEAARMRHGGMKASLLVPAGGKQDIVGGSNESQVESNKK